MRHANIVIGANYGDEGKGLMVDYLAEPDSLVVRFNGGAQAGHTVVAPDGQRHVFHHFGAGTLRGAASHLSRHVISNPLLIVSEQAALHAFGVTPTLSADPNGLVTTPYDMMLNQMAEEARGTARHGSCGLGINETIKRHSHALPLSVGLLGDSAYVRRLLDRIRQDWVPKRAAQLGLTIPPHWQRRFDNDVIAEAFIAQAASFPARVVEDKERLRGHPAMIVFEGAQGLLLDQDHRFFPHVTHAHTGLHNALELAEDGRIETLAVHYMTRAYLTRHGAGPLPHEQPGLRYPDATNVTNDWQGGLRFAPLGIDLLSESIRHDLRLVRTGTIKVTPSITVTCLDQIGTTALAVRHGQEITCSPSGLCEVIGDDSGIQVGHVSYGPTRTDIQQRLSRYR